MKRIDRIRNIIDVGRDEMYVTLKLMVMAQLEPGTFSSTRDQRLCSQLLSNQLAHLVSFVLASYWNNVEVRLTFEGSKLKKELTFICKIKTFKMILLHEDLKS